MSRKSVRTRLSALTLSAAMVLSVFAGTTQTVQAKENVNYLANENLAPGIHYSEEDITGYGTTGDRRVRMNHLSIDPSAEGVSFSTARAEDTINARENILNQALRDVYQGVNVVASVNADAYNMDYGLNLGIQVRDGALLVSQPDNRYTTDTPAFFVDGDGKAHIDSLRAEADITVGDGYTKTVGDINRNFGTHHDDPNATAFDTLRIYTSQLTSDATMTLYQAENMADAKRAYALIRLDGFDGDLQLGETYTGTVESVSEEEGFSIPEDCIVLAGYYGDAEGVKQLEQGAAVSFTCNLYTGAYTEENGVLTDRGTECNDVTAAVNGFHLLAKDGQVNTSVVNAQVGADVNARTVIGITADGKVEILCVNKPGTNFSSELTTGTTFSEITDYMMEELGCVDILNMDGGGSTEMTARRAGSDSLETVSYPSDGSSRLVSNSLLIISDAPRSADVAQVLVDGSSSLYPGSSADYSVRLTDSSGNALDSADYSVLWSAEKGTIDETGHYTAPNEAGVDQITATVNGVEGSAQVTVVDLSGVTSLALNASGTVALKKGDTYQFGFNATKADGQKVEIAPELAKWSLSGDPIGTLDEKGLLTVTAETGEAKVSCVFMDKTYTATVVIGLDEQIIDDFEGDERAYHISSRIVYPNHPSYQGGDSFNMVGTTSDQAKNGNKSLYWVYDTKDWTRQSNGTLYYWADWDTYNNSTGWTKEEQEAMLSRYRAKARPKKFGLWIYSGDENNDGKSDNYNCMMMANFYVNDGTWLDDNGTAHYDGADGGKIQSKSIKLTPTEKMDWIGWKYFEFDVPEDWPMPITFNNLWMSNINKSSEQANYRTTIRMDDMKWIYTDAEQDLQGPTFSETAPQAGGLVTDKLDFSTVITDESGVKADTISITVNGEAVTDYTFDEETGKLSFTKAGLKDKESYRVIVKAQDTKGNESVPYVDNTYTVDLSADQEAPTISNVTPASGCKTPVQIPSPRIGFKLSDAKSGVRADSIRVTLDGKEISDVYMDEATGWGYAQPDFELADGTKKAEITIDAADQAGNAMKTYRDTVQVSLISQPKDTKNYSISVIPDTQGNAYSDRIYPMAAKSDSELVIQLGDIVDNVKEEEFKEGKKWADSMKKPYLVAAGNHEGGNLDLDLYNEYFGSPTYSFRYGSTLIIMLNSAFKQSIEESDPTQYRFLERELEKNTLPNVYVINHVVAEDHFNTQHNMTEAECAKFENLLGAYKAKHPEVNVNAVFGHLHTLETWERQGVNYIIGGNGAGKGYVTQEQGNILGIGEIKVTNGKASYDFTPLLTKVYLRSAAMRGGKLLLAKGGSAQINVYGDFREKASVDSYMTQINDNKAVQILWSSSDEAVASVSDTGVVTVHGDGEAVITAECGGKKASFTVKSQDMKDVVVKKLELTLEGDIYKGADVTPVVTATDVYGSIIQLNSADVVFTTDNGTLEQKSDGILYAKKAGTDVLKAEFQGKTATLEVTVQAQEIESLINPGEITVEKGTAFDRLELPKQVSVTLNSKVQTEVDVEWKADNYDPSTAGTYVLRGILKPGENVENPSGLEAELRVIVKEKAEIANTEGGEEASGDSGNNGSSTGSSDSRRKAGGAATGDSANSLMWLILLAASGTTLAAIAVRKKKTH